MKLATIRKNVPMWMKIGTWYLLNWSKILNRGSNIADEISKNVLGAQLSFRCIFDENATLL